MNPSHVKSGLSSQTQRRSIHSAEKPACEPRNAAPGSGPGPGQGESTLWLIKTDWSLALCAWLSTCTPIHLCVCGSGGYRTVACWGRPAEQKNLEFYSASELSPAATRSLFTWQTTVSVGWCMSFTNLDPTSVVWWSRSLSDGWGERQHFRFTVWGAVTTLMHITPEGPVCTGAIIRRLFLQQRPRKVVSFSSKNNKP